MAAITQQVYVDYREAERRASLIKFVAALLFIAFFFWSIDVLNIPIERVFSMFGRLGHMITERLLPPDMAFVGETRVMDSIIETIQMSILGATIGTLITMPLAWLAAWNVTPSRRFLYPMARAIIVVTRGMPTLMWAMVLVAIFGFGPFAGMLALVKETIGFAGKLMAESVEAIDMKRVEALRATGANEFDVLFFAVIPQVWANWVGIIIYNWDAQLRNSTILGFVGAGGMGLYLREQISILEYHTAMAIIVVIIGLVVISETVSHHLRRRLY
ncbi:MAG: phosphonate ABC transporter, permease protein PhnE [Rhodospirillales bacterium]|nr:phosphonate ABC transporter, permease protein PhnE [Rhodospirillales bacterium]